MRTINENNYCNFFIDLIFKVLKLKWVVTMICLYFLCKAKYDLWACQLWCYISKDSPVFRILPWFTMENCKSIKFWDLRMHWKRKYMFLTIYDGYFRFSKWWPWTYPGNISASNYHTLVVFVPRSRNNCCSFLHVPGIKSCVFGSSLSPVTVLVGCLCLLLIRLWRMQQVWTISMTRSGACRSVPWRFWTCLPVAQRHFQQLSWL